MKDESWKAHLKEARIAAGFKKKTDFAKAMGVSNPTVTDWEKSVENGGIERMSAENIRRAAMLLKIDWADLMPTPPKFTTINERFENADYVVAASAPLRRRGDFEVLNADETDGERGEIEYWSAKGSCGGGFLNYDALPKGHLIKEASFFRKYDLRPADSFAIYADGSSMANFIVDGDLVIFDRSKTEPRTGEIYAIDHPDGLRIKRLRRDIDGSWILESDSPDKVKYPDERIMPAQGELLKILGKFVYRQGG